MPEMNTAFAMFPEFARMSATDTRAILNNYYVDRLPDRELMAKTLEREFGPEAREMGMRCYREIQPQDVKTPKPIKLHIPDIMKSAKEKSFSEKHSI